jgi:hypothetical protein
MLNATEDDDYLSKHYWLRDREKTREVMLKIQHESHLSLRANINFNFILVFI